MNKSHKFLLAFVFIGIALILSSTKIVLFLTGEKLELKQIEIPALSPDLRYHIDHISIPEGLLKSIFIKGWAFNPEYQAGSKRHVSVVLKSETGAYEIPANMESREDVKAYFTEYNLTANDLGFGCTFSSIAVKKGEYELFLKIWETGGEPKFINTHKTFIKEGVKFEEVLPKND